MRVCLSILGVLYSFSALSNRLLWNSARLASYEKRYHDVVKLWYVHQRIKSSQKEYHSFILSLAWQASDRLHLCPLGLEADEDLWPIVIYNKLHFYNRQRKTNFSGGRFNDYQNDLIRRKIKWSDILSSEEIENIQLKSSQCNIIPWATQKLGKNKDIEENLLKLSLKSHRVFNLDFLYKRLWLMKIIQHEKEMKKTSRNIEDLDIELKNIIYNIKHWSLDFWLSWDHSIRIYVFHLIDPWLESSDDLVLGLIDKLLDENKGKEAFDFMFFLHISKYPEKKKLLWEHERSEKIMLSPSNHFPCRGVLALYKGVDFIKKQDLYTGLLWLSRSLLWAKEEGAKDVSRLARRWIFSSLKVWRNDKHFLNIARDFLPPKEWRAMGINLLWISSLHGDIGSWNHLYNQMNSHQKLRIKNDSLFLKLLSERKSLIFIKEIKKTFRKKEARHQSVLFIKRFMKYYIEMPLDIRRGHLNHLLTFNKLLSHATPQRKSYQDLILNIENQLQILQKSKRLSQQFQSVSSKDDQIKILGNFYIPPQEPNLWPLEKPTVNTPPAPSVIKIEPWNWFDGDKEIFGWRLDS